MSSLFPPDEFDATIESAPVGVHRKPISPWRAALPFLVILIVAPSLAWGAVWLVQNTGSSGSSLAESDTMSGEDSVTDSGAETLTDTADGATDSTTNETQTTDTTGTEEATEEPEATDVVYYETTVRVLNNSGISGYAASIASVLEQEGYTSVSADNASGWATTTNTVFYASEDLESTAQDIAEALGFSEVSLNSTSVGTGIVVLLATR